MIRSSLKPVAFLLTLFLISSSLHAQTNSIIEEDVVFAEEDGFVTVEAEFFYKQSQSDVRQWYRFSKDEEPNVGRDEDRSHCFGASNNSYLEILPDTRVTHADSLINDENFCGMPGKMAVLHYKINFETTGRYYVWVRAYSTGGEDNGLHVGIDDEWPESGARLQWCEGKNSWKWESKQRTEEVHCGEPYLIYLDIEKAGDHEIMFSMREDGFEFDKFILAMDKDFTPSENGLQEVKVKSGRLPESFPVVEAEPVLKSSSYIDVFNTNKLDILKHYTASDFPIENTNFYLDQDKWLAIDPVSSKKATTIIQFNDQNKVCDLVFLGVGENDGSSNYSFALNGKEIGAFTPPMSTNTYEEGAIYCISFANIQIKKGDELAITAKIGSVDGEEFSRARIAGLVITESGKADLFLEKLEELMVNVFKVPAEEKVVVEVSGELKKWHKVTLTFDGPETSEDAEFNPFMNYRFNVEFTHDASGKKYLVPGYFAADGNAANTSATSGNKWRVHFAPDEIGEWKYNVDFVKGKFTAISDKKKSGKPAGYMDNASGAFKIEDTDKEGRDMRSKGMLQYVGERYLKFAGTGEYFLKVGTDAPENFLSYEEFDGTFHNDGHKDNLVKKWEAHEKDWKPGDPTWQDGKGKDIIGAVNYLAGKGLNAFSFLTMNIDGDDQNVFPYVDYDTYDRMDCSKLDQWETVFEHGDKLGMFLHFKTMEFENQGLLDHGGIGAFTKLYYRELIARFGHHLALNWNICEESGDWTEAKTPPQFTWQRLSAAAYFAEHDSYKHHIVIHNGVWYDDIYGHHSYYTGASLQTNNSDFRNVHSKTLQILKESKAAGKQWAVACDEPGDAQHALLPDAENPEHTNARMNGLWGQFLAGGWGTEWYFGYKHAHSDLSCEDYSSRDKFWDQANIALDFFSENEIPFWNMENHDELVLNENDYAFAKPGEIYVFYLKKGEAKVNLSSATSKLTVKWYDPRNGGKLQNGSKKKVNAGSDVDLGLPPDSKGKDWVVLIKK